MSSDAPPSSLYPTNELYFENRIERNVNEIKKYQVPDCIKSYFDYFEQWTLRLNDEERKILLNRLLQDEDLAFSVYLQNINEPYDVIKSRLIEHLAERNENLLYCKKERRRRKKLFKKMSKEEMANFVRTLYSELYSYSKERLVIKELTRIIPGKFKKLDLENTCSNVDEVIERMAEKMAAMKLKHQREGGEKKKPKKHPHHRLRRSSSSSSGSSSDSTSEDEKAKMHKKPHHHHHAK